jgi:ATP-binding cassette subfamily B protein
MLAIFPAKTGTPLPRLMRRLAGFLAPHQGTIAVCALLALAAPGVSALMLWWTQRLVDDVLVARDAQAFLAFAGLYMLIAGAKFLLDYLATRAEAQAAEGIVTDLRGALLAHLIAASPGTFAKRGAGDLIAHLSGDVERGQALIFSNPLRLFGDVVSLVVFLAFLLMLSVKLTLAALAVAPLLFIIARRYSPRIRRAAQTTRRRASRWTALAEERLAILPAIHAFSAQAREAARFRRACDANRQAELTSVRIQAWSSLAIEAAVSLGGLGVLAIGVHEIASGTLTIGALIAFLGGVGSLYGPVRSITRSVASFERAAAGAERIVNLLDTPSEVREPRPPRILASAKGEIEFRDVSFSYGGAPVLRDVSFKIAAGETVSLVGSSGGGKSTIVRLLLRFHDPDRGAILIDGIDIRELALADLRRAVTAVFQEPAIFRASIADNLRFAAPDADGALIRAAAADAHAAPFIEALPGRYLAPAGTRGHRLSGGQQQRLALARAFLRDSPILILDEATAAIDGETETLIQDAIARQASRRTLLVIGHRLASLRGAERVIVIDQGRVIEDARPHSLLGAESRYRALFASQLDIDRAPA